MPTTFILFLLSRAVKHWEHFVQETLGKNKLNGIYMNGTATFVLGAYVQKLKCLVSSDLSWSSNPCVGSKEHQEGVPEALCLLRSRDFSIGLHYPLPQIGRQSCSVMLFFWKDKSETARVCCEADKKICSILVSVLPGFIARPGESTPLVEFVLGRSARHTDLEPNLRTGSQIEALKEIHQNDVKCY